jgi:hypothetical protein
MFRALTLHIFLLGPFMIDHLLAVIDLLHVAHPRDVLSTGPYRNHTGRTGQYIRSTSTTYGTSPTPDTPQQVL